VRLHVHEWGPSGAPPILCVHGITSWGGRFRRLAESRLGAYRVIAVDLRGHGESDWDPPWSLGAHVGDIVDTLDGLKLDRVDVVGHSFGGRLALELASRHPERVRRIVMLDPAVWVPPHIALEYAEHAREDVTYASVEEAIAERLAQNARTDEALVREELPLYLHETEDGRWRGRFTPSAIVTAYSEMAKAPPLEQVATPTLLVRGHDSEVIPEQLADFVCATMSDCSAVTVPGGHIVMWDALDETADAILGFLGKPAA
jgi:lipase